MMILHTANKAEFETEIQTGRYGSKSLEKCGFIHCSDLDTYYLVAPNFKDDDAEKVILLIDTDKLNSEVKWEDGGGLDFPHVYGLLNREAITGVYEHLWSDTREWIPNEELQEYAVNGFRRPLECIFCRIISGEVPSRKVYEDEWSLAFMDAAKDVDGHILVVPKAHRKNILDCDEATLTSVMKTVKKISNHLVEDCGYNGVNLLHASDESAGQSVPHFHVHIIPRKTGDNMDAWPHFDGAKQDLEETFNKIRFSDEDEVERMVLIEPTAEYSRQIQAYRQAFLDSGDSMDGTSGLRKFEDPLEWLDFLAKHKDPKTLPGGRVPATQFIFVREEDRKIVGMIDIRIHLSEYLEKFGGHIGYSVVPDERRKGYATKMLKAALPVCRELGITKVLVTCIQGNEGSKRTILNNGGVYESTVYEPDEQVELERYWITL